MILTDPPLDLKMWSERCACRKATVGKRPAWACLPRVEKSLSPPKSIGKPSCTICDTYTIVVYSRRQTDVQRHSHSKIWGNADRAEAGTALAKIHGTPITVK